MKPFNKRELATLERAENLIRERMQDYGVALDSPDHTRRLLTTRFAQGDQQREVFTVMFLNAQNQLIEVEDVFTGTLDGAAVYPREVVRKALQLGAAACIFAHNHPSGTPEPSHADRRITERLQAALMLMDIKVLDHIIVCGTNTYSFSESGLL
jgi:DNA repair protein RadC